jgi:hypothetical protein
MRNLFRVSLLLPVRAVGLIGYVSGSLCRGYLGWLLKEWPQILQLVEQVPDIVTGTPLPVQVQVGDF